MRIIVSILILIALVTGILYCSEQKPQIGDLKLDTKGPEREITLQNRRISRLVRDSIALRQKAVSDSLKFSMAVISLKQEIKALKKKATKIDLKKASIPELDSVVHELYEGVIIFSGNDSTWTTDLNTGRVVVADAARSYIQDSIISKQDSAIVTLEQSQASTRQNFQSLLSIEHQKYKAKSEIADLEGSLKMHYAAEARKFKKQRNKIATIGVAVATFFAVKKR